ncbi:hypothetical protein CROQUDRAFT_53385, partial [Cronartium quercuum f. sp. fusiforme G11]
LFQRILYLQEQVYNEGLELPGSDLYADTCPRCFGPAIGEMKDSPTVPCFIVALDANFQQWHHIYSSKDSSTEADYSSSFLRPLQITKQENLCKMTTAQVKDLKARIACSDSHTAANDTCTSASIRKACDDNGLFGMTCWHDIPLKFINIFDPGEKLHYPISILSDLLHNHPDHQVGVLYDIGCHLEAHIKKVFFFLAFPLCNYN